MNNEAVKILNALNAELEDQSNIKLKFDDELRDGGEWVFEYRDGALRQIGYFPLRAVNDPIPVWTYKDGHKSVVAVDVKDWYENFFDFASFASVDWFK